MTRRGWMAMALGLVVLAGGLYFYLQGKLRLDTPREWYFIYVSALLALALLLAPFRKLGAIVLLVATLEIGLGLGSAALFKFGLVNTALLPEDEYLEPPFQWHPLLQAVPVPTQPGSIWEKNGVHHNAQGLRGLERTPQSFDGKVVIELFGNSAAYDFYARDGGTWVDQLEQLLGKDGYVVLNRAVSGYSTAEHLMQTAFYQTPYGETPRCAIYQVGWGDLPNARIKGLDPGYADYHMPWLIDALQARRLGSPLLVVSPIWALLEPYAAALVDTVRPAVEPARTPGGGPDEAFEAIYVRNLHAISAINRQRGIKTIWLAQTMNRNAANKGAATLAEGTQRLNEVLKREAEAMGDLYIDVPTDTFDASDFKDIIHFVPTGSAKLARLLAPVLAEACR
jgi:lysophospholipase L1-like esterase